MLSSVGYLLFAGLGLRPAFAQNCKRVQCQAMADSKSVPGPLSGAVSMGRGRRNRFLLVLRNVSAATDLDDVDP